MVTKAPPKIPKPPQEQPAATVRIGGESLPLVDIRSTGDLLLDVSFKNASDCTKSIPKDALRILRTQQIPIPSPRIVYRVKLETLTKHSEYLRILLKPQFSEGLAVAETLAKLAKSNQDPTKVEAEKLPVVRIEEEDLGTKTMGREIIFKDMMRVIHGADPLTIPYTTHGLTILVLMADRYNVTAIVTRNMQKTFLDHKFAAGTDKNFGEEALRQKILIHYHTEAYGRFVVSTKELILKGSTRWTGMETNSAEFQTMWWELPFGLEAELAFRRARLLRTIASIQNQFLAIYSSRDRQCKLGYDSSSSCDSFQLGEAVKFLARKGLLSLVPFQAASPDDADYVWPEAYTGDIDYLIGVLRQCPSYQIDKHHGHCGLRSKLLPALDYIKSSMDSGIGIKLTRSTFKRGPTYDSWLDGQASNTKKPFFVRNENGEDVDVAGGKPKQFDFFHAKQKIGFGSSNEKGLFMAETWNWATEPEGTNIHFGVMR